MLGRRAFRPSSSLLLPVNLLTLFRISHVLRANTRIDVWIRGGWAWFATIRIAPGFLTRPSFKSAVNCAVLSRSIREACSSKAGAGKRRIVGQEGEQCVLL